MNYVTSLMLGILVGGAFQFCSMAPPAPATLAGILGVVGIYLGSVIAKFVM